jgi:hypothetical protein
LFITGGITATAHHDVIKQGSAVGYVSPAHFRFFLRICPASGGVRAGDLHAAGAMDKDGFWLIIPDTLIIKNASQS